MGRTRTKSRKAQAAGAAPSTAAKPDTVQQEPSIPALLEKAQTLIIQCDYGLAERFVRRILEREQSHAAAKEMLGVSHLELGELEQAKQVRAATSSSRSLILIDA